MLDVAVQQNLDEFDDFLAARGQLLRTLKVALSDDAIDINAVERMGAEVGEIKVRMTWAQAIAMLNVRDALSEPQLAELLGLWANYTVETSELSTEDPVDLGRQLFAQCALCHALSRNDAVAPVLPAWSAVRSPRKMPSTATHPRLWPSRQRKPLGAMPYWTAS